MPSAIFVSPHLDDVAFSCGGMARQLANAGWSTVLCTVFTRSVPNPQGFGLACQTDKGLAPEVDYMRLRRCEDAEAAHHLRAHDVRWLDLPEAPHRGYHSATALFGPFVAQDDVQPELDERLAHEVRDHDLVFAPQAIGEHVDHRRVRDTIVGAGIWDRVTWYRDTPYAIRHPNAAPAIEIMSEGTELAITLGEATLDAKLAACAAYRSQLGFQFTGEETMRVSLSDFAAAEALRLGLAGGRAEALIASPEAAARLT